MYPVILEECVIMADRKSTATLQAEGSRRSSNLWMEALRNVVHNPSAILGMSIIGTLIVIAIVAPLIATHDPILSMIGVPGETGRLPGKPPCIPALGCEEPMHILGLDLNARDLFSRVIFGTRTSLSVGIITISLSITVGTLLGVTAGYAGGAVDNVIMRLMDVVLAFPALLLAISIVTILGPGLLNALLGITITFIPQYARLSRASVLSLKEQEFVLAEKALGANPLRIVFFTYSAEFNYTHYRSRHFRCRHSGFGCGGSFIFGSWSTTTNAGMGADFK